MRKADIKVGGTYVAKVSGRLVPLTVLQVECQIDPFTFQEKTRWVCRNERTGRHIWVFGAQRFRRPCSALTKGGA